VNTRDAGASETREPISQITQNKQNGRNMEGKLKFSQALNWQYLGGIFFAVFQQ
jgi:hypothetical protein